MDYKELKKLADACRKAGIKHFKNADLEFTLTDNVPTSNYKKREANKPRGVTVMQSDIIQENALTEEQLLNWSVMDLSEQGSI